MQSELDSKNSQPQETPSELPKREDSAKAKIHPETNPPEVIFKETLNKEVVENKGTENSEQNMLIETPLSPPNQRDDEKLKLLSHNTEDAKIPNKDEQKTIQRTCLLHKKSQELKTYQKHLLPEGVSSTEKLLDIYEMDRKRKKFAPIKEYPDLHKEGITCLVLTSDDKYIITGSSDQSIKITDLETKQEIHSFGQAHQGSVNSICVTPDGQFLLSGSEDHSLKIWNLETKRLVRHIREVHHSAIFTLKISNNGKFVVTGSQDGSAKIINLQTYQEIHHFESIHEKAINAIALTPDDKFLITGSADSSIIIFDLQTKKSIHKFKDVHNGVTCLATNLDGRFIISGGGIRESHVKIFDIENRQEIHHFQNIHKGKITSILVSPDGKYFVSTGEDCYVHIIDMQTREPKSYYRVADELNDSQAVIEQHCIKALAITSDSGYIVTGSADRSVKLLKVKGPERVYTFARAHSSDVNCVVITIDNNFAISGSSDNSIKIFNIKTKKEVHHIKNVHCLPINTLAVTRDGKFFISGSEDGTIIIWDLKELKQVHQFEMVHEDGIRSITVTPNNKFFISGSYDSTLKIFDLQTKELVHHLETSDRINSIAVTPDSKYLIAAYERQKIDVFDLQTYELVYTFENAHTRGVNSIALTTDGKLLISASKDGSFKIFDFESKQELHCFESPRNDEVISVKTFEDNYFIAGFKNGAIKIYDLETYELLHHIPKAHQKMVKSVAVTTDGRYLVSGSDDNSVKIFCLRPEEIQTTRNLEHSPETQITALAIIPDGKYFITGGEDKKIKFFDLNTQQEVYCKSDAHTAKITSLQVSQDNRFLVSGSQDKSIKIFDVKTRKELHHFQNIQNYYMMCLTITPDSKYIVTGCEQDYIKILDINTHQTVNRFMNESAKGVYCLTVTSDSRYIVAGYIHHMRIFDIQTKEEVFHFKQAHQRAVVSITISPDDKYIVSGSDDGTFKIFDFQTRQLVYTFNCVRRKYIESSVERVAVTPDSKYIISAGTDMLQVFNIETKQIVQTTLDRLGRQPREIALSPDGKSVVATYYTDASTKLVVSAGNTAPSIKIIRLELESSKDYCENDLEYLQKETFTISKKMKCLTFFNCFDNFLFEEKMHPDDLETEILKHQDLVIYPYSWTVLHILALQSQTAFLKELPELANKFKMPFLLDHFGKTPLHYLMANRKIDFAAVNSLFSFICDYLDECFLRNVHEFQEILKSLAILLPFIFSKIDSRLKERFLLLSFASAPVPFKEELPLFGHASSKSCFYELPVLDKNSKERIWKDGETQVSCQTNFLYLDYNANSQDMQTMVDLMIKQKNEDFFKTSLISKLIDHLWNQTQTPLIISFFVFSIFMSGLSVYLCLQEQNLAFEIVLLALSGVWILAEGLQIYDLGKDYLNNFWNVLDICHLFLTVAFLITRLAESENELARAWISSIVVALGYLRWVSYLRIFQATRNLIQVIITIAKDMVSFVVIIGMIIFGFSIIFLVFERESEYGIYLYNTYSILYGPLDIDDDAKYSVSLKLIMVVIAFLLNVLLLNLLISIMGDSYDKILEKREKTDSLTRLEIMSEAMTYMKFLKTNYKSKRGYLLYCLSLDVEEDENASDEWEGRINVMKKLLKQSNEETKGLREITEKKIQELNEKIEESQQKVAQKIQESHQELQQNMYLMMQEFLQDKNNRGSGIEPQKKIAGIQEFLQK